MITTTTTINKLNALNCKNKSTNSKSTNDNSTNNRSINNKPANNNQAYYKQQQKQIESYELTKEQKLMVKQEMKRRLRNKGILKKRKYKKPSLSYFKEATLEKYKNEISNKNYEELELMSESQLDDFYEMILLTHGEKLVFKRIKHLLKIFRLLKIKQCKFLSPMFTPILRWINSHKHKTDEVYDLVMWEVQHMYNVLDDEEFEKFRNLVKSEISKSPDDKEKKDKRDALVNPCCHRRNPKLLTRKMKELLDKEDKKLSKHRRIFINGPKDLLKKYNEIINQRYRDRMIDKPTKRVKRAIKEKDGFFRPASRPVFKEKRKRTVSFKKMVQIRGFIC
jgi:hypothetical protein